MPRWEVPPESPTDYLVATDTVTDNVTGLVWQREVAQGTYTWNDAKTYCSALSVAGASDWRLPTAAELLTIVDSSRFNPAIGAAFLNSPNGPMWSSTSTPWLSEHAFYVSFFNGGVLHWDESQFSVTKAYPIRCVRAPSAVDAVVGSRYLVDADTVVAQVTGLTWQRAVEKTNRDWAWADEYCRTLNLGGWSSGWRLPRKKELESLVDRRRSYPAIDTTAFPLTPSSYTWTGTVSGSSGWAVIFDKGREEMVDVHDWAIYVRCVR